MVILESRSKMNLSLYSDNITYYYDIGNFAIDFENAVIT